MKNILHTLVISSVVVLSSFLLALPVHAGEFADNFNDGVLDGWTAIGSHKVHTDFGNWRIENNELVEDAGGDGFMIFPDGLNLSTQVVSTKVKYPGPAGYGGFVLWFNDYDNLIFINPYPAAGNIYISHIFNGTLTGYAYPIFLNEEQWYDLQADADSVTGDIKIYLDNSYLFTFHATTTNRSGKTGLMTGNSGSFFDDFSINSVDITDPLVNKYQCMKGSWKNYSDPTFKNQGECVSFLMSNSKSGKR